MTANSWIDEIDQWTDVEVPQAIIEFTQLVTMECLRGVVLMSPVKWGRFRSNHQTSISIHLSLIHI